MAWEPSQPGKKSWSQRRDGPGPVRGAGPVPRREPRGSPSQLKLQAEHRDLLCTGWGEREIVKEGKGQKNSQSVCGEHPGATCFQNARVWGSPAASGT